MYSLSEAIEKWNEGSLKGSTFDVMAVVTGCYRDEPRNNSDPFRRLGLADSQARAVFRVSPTQGSSFPIEGSVVCFRSVLMRKSTMGVELRQDGRLHEGPLWHVLLPHNATTEQRQQNKQAASLWSWWQQQTMKGLTLPKCVDRTLAEFASTTGLKGHVVAHVCQVHMTGNVKQSHKRTHYSRKTSQATALLMDSSRTTFVSLLDRTGSNSIKLEHAQRTQTPIRLTFVQSTVTNGEDVVLVTTNETRIEMVEETTLTCLSPESPALHLSAPKTRMILSSLYRINGSRIIQYLPLGQHALLEIENQTVLATYSVMHNVLSCGGDVLILQALVDEAIPLRWIIDASGNVLRASLVGFPLMRHRHNR